MSDVHLMHLRGTFPERAHTFRTKTDRAATTGWTLAPDKEKPRAVPEGH